MVKVKDPICGMEVDPKKAEKKNLVVKKDKTHYFCSQNCKDKFLNNTPWYKSQTFAKVFPWFLAVVLIGFFVLSILFDFMLLYMGIFFIVFSLFKIIDWKGFVNAFSMYDILAKHFKPYAWVYPAIEFILGLLYLFKIYILGSAWVTLFIMGIGAIGVGKNMMSKNKIQCACLGTKINVPLTKVTLLENILMFIMALVLILSL